ncbi:MAG: hypothetical protein VX733_00460 [Candidatus Latescibacterota bacterium]|nr:hypothetical protein [Candidatus Latescibacterota bacterium]
MNPLLLSERGSDRAVGYGLSSKLGRAGRQLLVGWVDASVKQGDRAQICLGVCDLVADGAASLSQTQTLGEGIDNHYGPALSLDGNGRLHAMIGDHHGPFLFRWSDGPADPGSWSDAEPLG